MFREFLRTNAAAFYKTAVEFANYLAWQT